MPSSLPFRLSICIPTYNRAVFLAQLLDSIIAQATSDCEIVISDNASNDNTQQVASEYGLRFSGLRYLRQNQNIGADRNSDCAVEAATGEYCWLFSDDDLMKPGAIATVLEILQDGHSLVLVNGEHRDFTMSQVRVPNFFSIDSDCVYSSKDYEQLFLDVGTCAMCMCCVVIKRSLWISRERQRYYDSWFLHTAIVFQQPVPGTTLVLAKPLMSLRLGNQQHASFKVWYMLWPALLWSFPLNEVTKIRYCRRDPWRRANFLLALRVLGEYSHADYVRWLRPALSSLRKRVTPRLIALLPRQIAFFVYRIVSLAQGTPRSPHDLVWTMFPKSLRVLL